MVYGGRPSRGCQTCKSRKIKCDEARPTCAQCKKSSRTCLGYKDEADLIFRNQTDKVVHNVRQPVKIRKARQLATPRPNVTNKDALKKGQSGSHAMGVFHECPSLVIVKRDIAEVSIRAPPSLPIEEQVVQAYFKNFAILYQSEDTLRGFLPFLVPMYKSSAEGSALRVATWAAALVAISQLPGQRQLAQRATLAYGRAILSVARALQDPTQATSDETLQATLLLCLYESIKATDGSIKAWSNHVDGATALVRSRGIGQFGNLQSLALFRTARTYMLINCIRQEVAPQDFPADKGWLSDNATFEDPMKIVTGCALELPPLLAQVRYLQQAWEPTLRGEMSDVVDKAYGLLLRVSRTIASLPQIWQPKTIAYVIEEPKDIYNAEAWVGAVHTYTDVRVASVLNKIRSICIFSTWVVMDCIQQLRPNDYILDERYQHSEFIERITVDDVCASVPFHLSWQSGTKAKDPDQIETIANLIGGLSLVWPLGGVVSSPRISSNQKEWVIGRLRKISQDCGLEQALLVNTGVRRPLHEIFDSPLHSNGRR